MPLEDFEKFEPVFLTLFLRTIRNRGSGAQHKSWQIIDIVSQNCHCCRFESKCEQWFEWDEIRELIIAESSRDSEYLLIAYYVKSIDIRFICAKLHLLLTLTLSFHLATSFVIMYSSLCAFGVCVCACVVCSSCATPFQIVYLTNGALRSNRANICSCVVRSILLRSLSQCLI